MAKHVMGAKLSQRQTVILHHILRSICGKITLQTTFHFHWNANYYSILIYGTPYIRYNRLCMLHEKMRKMLTVGALQLIFKNMAIQGKCICPQLASNINTIKRRNVWIKTHCSAYFLCIKKCILSSKVKESIQRWHDFFVCIF